jgi:hypothetical protein
MKLKYYCTDCGIEAVIEITDNPWEADPDDLVNGCFHCGDDGVTSEVLDD